MITEFAVGILYTFGRFGNQKATAKCDTMLVVIHCKWNAYAYNAEGLGGGMKCWHDDCDSVKQTMCVKAQKVRRNQENSWVILRKKE